MTHACILASLFVLQLGEPPMPKEKNAAIIQLIESCGGTVTRQKRGYEVQSWGIEDSGRADRLSEAITQLPKVCEIWLPACKISDQGLVSIGKIDSLEKLSLHSINITGTGLAHLRSLKSLRSLTCESATTDDGLKSIGQMTELRELSLSGPNITCAGTAHLTALDKLETIRFPTAAMKGDLSPLKKLSKLKKLDLEWSNVDDATLETIAGMENLDTLYMGFTKLTDACVPTLRTFPKLKDLSLRNTSLTTVGIRQLCKSGLSLEDLCICEISVDDETIQALGTMKSLKTLWMLNVELTGPQLQQLKSLLPKCKILN